MERFLLKFLLLFCIVLGCQGCIEKAQYQKGSLTGPWRCHEQSSRMSYRIYNVSIERDTQDTSRFTILNMYNVGYQFETYATLNDTVLTILGTNDLSTAISGNGYISRDWMTISWIYNYNGPSFSDIGIDAVYYRP